MKLLTNNFYSLTGEKKHIFGCKWSTIKRYYALFLWCCGILALYFCYDIPGSLQNQIMESYKLTSLEFSYLYSVYSWPNIIMCFIGGFLVDRVFGPRLGLIIYSGIATIGMILFMIGGNIDAYFLMLTGRFILGIGCESAAVAIYNYTVQWFSGKELNMVFAIVLNIGRIGSSLVFEGSEPTLKSIEASGTPKEKVLGHTIIALGSVIIICFVSALLSGLLKPDQTEEEKKAEANDKKEDKPVVKLSDVFTFPIQYWLLTIIIDVYINSIYSFLGLSQATLTMKFNISDATANSYISFFSFFGAALSPVLGIMIDKKGKNLSYVTFAIISGIIGFMILAFTEINAYVCMFVLSVSIAALLSSAWSLFSYIIPDHQLGTAFGIIQALMNIMLSAGSITAGAIADQYGYKTMLIYLLVLLLGTVPLLIWSWVLDIKQTKILNMSAEKRKVFLEKQNSSEVPRKISTIANNYSSEQDKEINNA